MRVLTVLLIAAALCACGGERPQTRRDEPATMSEQMAVVTDAPLVGEINKMHACGGQLTYITPHFFTFYGYSSTFTCYKMVGTYTLAQKCQ